MCLEICIRVNQNVPLRLQTVYPVVQYCFKQNKSKSVSISNLPYKTLWFV